eukprot:sb/3474397/
MIRFVLLVTLLLFPSVHCKQCTLLVVAELNRDSTGPPYSFLTVVKDVKEDATLIDVMESAENQGFTYEASWHGQWGAFIDTVNGVYADSGKRQFWNIMIGLPGEVMKASPLGVSSYKPRDGERVLFRLKTWGDGIDHY